MDRRGREASHPGEIPPEGWKDVFWRAWREISDQNLFLIAGGVTYAILLALFPGLATLVSLYGLVFDAGQIDTDPDAFLAAIRVDRRFPGVGRELELRPRQLVSDVVQRAVEPAQLDAADWVHFKSNLPLIRLR